MLLKDPISHVLLLREPFYRLILALRLEMRGARQCVTRTAYLAFEVDRDVSKRSETSAAAREPAQILLARVSVPVRLEGGGSRVFLRAIVTDVVCWALL